MAYPDRNFRADTKPLPKAIYGLGIIAALAVLFVALSGAHMSEKSVTNTPASPISTTAPQPDTNE
jgi:hypothetical protein